MHQAASCYGLVHKDPKAINRPLNALAIAVTSGNITRMMPRLFITAFLVCLAVPAWSDEPQKNDKAQFTRFVEDDQGARLQTGIATYVNKDGVTVDLIGAIHIADKAYYEKLNERFTQYDALLYEMVGEAFEKRVARKKAKEESKELEATPEETEEAAAGKKLAWLHPLYDTMEKTLGLSGQMRCIDYSKANFVHADMTMKEFSDMQNKKNESFLKLWLSSVVAQMKNPHAAPEQPGLLKFMEILCSKDSSTELRRVLGRMFGSMENMLAGMDTEDGTVIVTERNIVALKVMQDQIKLGQKNLGVFYGAAHLPDMDKRMQNLGFKRIKSEWLTAWDLPPEPKEQVGDEKPAPDSKSRP